MPYRAGRVAHGGRWSKAAQAAATPCVSLDAGTADFDLEDLEDMPWPPRAKIGEAPSPYVKLAALLEANSNDDELWEFTAAAVVARLKDKTRPRSPSKGPQTKEPKPAQDRSGAVRKLRLAKALECPVPPGPVECPKHPRKTVLLGQHLDHTESPSVVTMETAHIHKMLLKAGGCAERKLEQVRLQGVPEDWDFSSLSAVFQRIGLCMHCDVGLVDMESQGCFLINLNSEAATLKCLQLDNFLVQHRGVPWPLSARRAAAEAPQASPAPPQASLAPPAPVFRGGPPQERALHAQDLERRLLDIAVAPARGESREPLEEPAPTSTPRAQAPRAEAQAKGAPDIAGDLAGSYDSTESINKLAHMFLLDALSKPVVALTPDVTGRRPLWADYSDDVPDEDNLLKALMQ